MKHRPGKSGKRKGPVGYRTASTFLHRKSKQITQLQHLDKKKDQ